MSAVRMMAVAAWTQLVDAMRADGLIDPAITKSGPATTAVLVDLVQATVPAEQRGPWLSMSIKPRPGRQVVALDVLGKLCVLHWEDHGVRGTWVWNGSPVDPERFVAYTFISNFDGVRK